MRTVIHTDGACKKEGNGGCAAIIDTPETTIAIYEHIPNTTNNVAELQGVIAGLEALPTPSSVLVKSDSKYVVDGVRVHLASWKANGWRRTNGKPLSNLSHWKKIDMLVAQHDVSIEWVKGHNGDVANELADVLAQSACHLPKD